MGTSKFVKQALLMGAMHSMVAASNERMYDRPTVSTQCTGRGNETKPIGHVKKKKKAFGAPKLSKKQRKSK